jgi:hypothetical protein
MSNKSKVRAKSREAGGWLFVAATVDAVSRGHARVMHAAVSPDGMIAIHEDGVPAVDDMDRLLHAIVSGTTTTNDGKVLPGNPPPEKTGRKPFWRQVSPSNLSRSLGGAMDLEPVKRLFARLDSRILDLVKFDVQLHPETYNLLVDHPEALLDLKDAATRHPWLFDGMSLNTLAKRAVAARREGEPLFSGGGDNAARSFVIGGVWVDDKRQDSSQNQHWPVSTPAIRRLAGLPSRERAVRQSHIHFLSTIPAAWMPVQKSPDWWITKALSAIVGTEFCPNPEDLDRLLAGCKGDFAALASKLEGSGGKISLHDRVQAVTRTLSQIKDMWNTFQRDVTFPILDLAGYHPNTRFKLEVNRNLLGAGSLLQWASLSEAWHARERAIRVAIEASDARTWPALTKPFRAPNRLDVVALVSASELDAEGTRGIDENGVEGMAHCVATRASDCAEGRCHVYSVREAIKRGHRRISTFEVQLRGGDVLITEHKGRSNGEPSAAAKAAAEAWRTAAASGILVMDEAAQQRRPRIERVVRSPEDHLRLAIAAWSPLMKRRYRNMEPIDLGLEVVELIGG